MKKTVLIHRLHHGVRVYLKDGSFTNCYDPSEATPLTIEEATAYVEQSTPYCSYYMTDLNGGWI